jgi:hypothetical protein
MLVAAAGEADQPNFPAPTVIITTPVRISTVGPLAR